MNRRDGATGLRAPIQAVCFDWGGTLMVDDGPDGVPMCLWPRVAVVPGARDCLAALHGHVPLYLATNAAQSSRGMIAQALGRVDLLRYVSDIFCFTGIGFRKDHPGFWNAVRQRVGVPLERVVMVGDSLEHDVRGPGRFGLQTVWFDRDGTRRPTGDPVPTVTDLRQLPELVPVDPA